MTASHLGNKLKNPKAVRFLGIETSCDETAVAVVERAPDGLYQVLAESLYSQISEHQAYGGVVPEIAARAHVEAISHHYHACMAALLRDHGLGLADLDGIAATSGPGLIGGVMVGLSFAKGLALMQNLKLYGINHLEGHALSALLSGQVRFPYVLLLVSGGHSQILIVKGVGDYQRLATTIDDAVGEAFDKTAKILNLGYPGGPALEKEALLGNPARFELPRALLGQKTLDFSFSGLKTAASRLAFSDVKTHQDRADLCASVQYAISLQLCDRVAKSMRLMGEICHEVQAPQLIVAGGVAANQTIRAALQKLCDHNGFEFLAPPMKYCTDNAAMIALSGICRYEASLSSDTLFSWEDQKEQQAMPARPRWPLDENTARLHPIHKLKSRKGVKA